MASVFGLRLFFAGLSVVIVAVLLQPVNQRLTTLGFKRSLSSLPVVHGHTTRIIAGAQQCEDVHYHAESGVLYAACQTGDLNNRYKWFPPLGIFNDHGKAHGGGIVVIDPFTFDAHPLTLRGMKHDFVTHGIDVATDPEDSENVYIFAVNHLPNPQHYLANGERDSSRPRARSQVEVFTHRRGSDFAVHKRAIRSPLITTPNDILALSTRDLYVTNDHYYREGLGRLFEDFMTRGAAPWSNITFVHIIDVESSSSTTGFDAYSVMDTLHNNNGLGHAGPDHKAELLVTDASGGVLYRAHHPQVMQEKLQIVEEIQMPILLDNPSWYEDQWKTADDDASGYILNGLARGIDLAGHMHDQSTPLSVQVYHVRVNHSPGTTRHADWEKRLIYSDKGDQLNTVSGAVVIGIDPAENEGKKQGWLFMTGFASKNMIATKIDL